MKKQLCILVSGFLFFGGLFSVYAQDLIILRNGNVIEAKVAEISPTEIKYRRFNHLDGPIITIARTDVLSIRYENDTVEIINPVFVTGQEGNQPGQRQVPLPGEPSLLQQVLNQLPAIPIAGNNLKFEFRDETWIARVNGENFSAGTIEFEESNEGGILTLKQTHIWPGAVGRTAGRIAGMIPGGSAVGGVLNTAGNIAGNVGAVEMSGVEIVLEYKAGPPASLRLLSVFNDTANARTEDNKTRKYANARDNYISVEINMGGAGFRYERMLNSIFSLGTNIYFQYFGYFSFGDFGLDFTTRIYPGGAAFYFGVDFGFHFNLDNYRTQSNLGFAITPGIGVKIDAGRPGDFFMDIGIKSPQLFGLAGYNPAFVAYIGFGGAF